jgi:hypothetical protein
MEKFKIGDFVTQYSKGYWRIEKIITVRQDIINDNGDKREIALLRKVCGEDFTPRTAIETCHTALLQQLSTAENERISKLLNNPKIKNKFENYPISKCPSTIFNIDLYLTEKDFIHIQDKLNKLSFPLYNDELKKFYKELNAYKSLHRNYLLQFINQGFEIDKNSYPIWHKYKLSEIF